MRDCAERTRPRGRVGYRVKETCIEAFGPSPGEFVPFRALAALFSLGKTMSSRSAAFRRLSARRTALLQPGPYGMARAFSIAVTAFFQVRTLMAKSLLISSERLCLVAMVRSSISRLRPHQPSYAFITAMLLKPAKAFRQLPQIVSMWADRQLARAPERIL